MRRNLSPALFPSWQATCQAFGAAISAGPGLVILVGGPGSGKTFTLLAFAGGASGQKVSLRGINEPIEPGTEIDLIDNVDAKAVAGLAAFKGTRAVAIRPNLVDAVVRAFPGARVVTVRPMSSRDIRVMVEVRRPQLGLPVGYFTSKALARMDELCRGNPRLLDDLLFLSLRLAAAAATARVAPGHVERAALQLVKDQTGAPHGPASLDREAVLEMLHQSETQRRGVGRGSAPLRANAHSSLAYKPAARRGVQPIPARSTARAVAKHETPARNPQSAALATINGAPAPARTRRGSALRSVNPEQAGSRRRLIGGQSYALAVVAVVALAVTAREAPTGLSWLSGSGQSVANAPAPSTGGAVTATTPALAQAGPAQPLPTLGATTSAPAATALQYPASPLPVAPEAGMLPPETLTGSVVDPDRSAVAEPANSALAPDPPIIAPLPGAIVVTPLQPAGQVAPPENAGSAAAARPKDAKEAARLLSLGKALFAINQIADAKEVMRSSAELGNSEAAAILDAYDAPNGSRRPRSRNVLPSEHDGTHARAPIVNARRNRD